PYRLGLVSVPAYSGRATQRKDQGLDESLSEPCGHRVSDLPHTVAALAGEAITRREGLQGGELHGPQTAGCPVKRPDPRPRVGLDGPRRQVGTQLQEEAPEPRLRLEDRVGMSRPGTECFVVLTRRHFAELLRIAPLDDLFGLEVALILQGPQGLTGIDRRRE